MQFKKSTVCVAVGMLIALSMIITIELRNMNPGPMSDREIVPENTVVYEIPQTIKKERARPSQEMIDLLMRMLEAPNVDLRKFHRNGNVTIVFTENKKLFTVTTPNPRITANSEWQNKSVWLYMRPAGTKTKENLILWNYDILHNSITRGFTREDIPSGYTNSDYWQHCHEEFLVLANTHFR